MNFLIYTDKCESKFHTWIFLSIPFDSTKHFPYSLFIQLLHIHVINNLFIYFSFLFFFFPLYFPSPSWGQTCTHTHTHTHVQTEACQPSRASRQMWQLQSTKIIYEVKKKKKCQNKEKKEKNEWNNVEKE